MRKDPFTETLECDLTEDERSDRGREAARKAQAIERYKAETKRLEDDWKKVKAERKEGEDERIKELYRVSQAAETGKETREVPCEEVLVGVMVEVRRKGGDRHGEFVSARAATKDELRGAEKPKGASPETRAEKLRAGIARLTVKGRPEAAVLLALEKAVPESTPDERRTAITKTIEDGLVDERDGKLVWVSLTPAAAAGADDAVVPDDYKPATH